MRCLVGPLFSAKMQPKHRQELFRLLIVTGNQVTKHVHDEAYYVSLRYCLSTSDQCRMMQVKFSVSIAVARSTQPMN